MRAKRKSKGTWTKENHDILNGMAQIFRVNQSGEVWQLRMWIPQEKKYLRQSLRTRDLETAKQRAEEKCLQTYSDVQTGRKIFGITLQELVDSFLEWRKKDIGLITEGRWNTIKVQTNRVLEYKSGDLKVAELDVNSFYDYQQHRINTKGASLVTIRNEQATINQMIAFGYRQGLCHFQQLEFRPIRIAKDEVGKRDVFTLSEYDKLVRYLRTYTNDKECKKDDFIKRERLMVRYCILIASNTMMRVGELWNLTWGDVLNVEKTKDNQNQDVHLVTINVRAETSKVRSSRKIISRGGEYFLKLKQNTEYTDKKHYVFSSIDGTHQFDKRKWYLHWGALMRGIGIDDYKERNLTWYSLRHFGITCRIRANVSFSDISKVAGTSVSNIENHYGHYDDDMLKNTALKNFSVKIDGLALND